MATPNENRAFIAKLDAVQQAGGIEDFVSEVRAEFKTAASQWMRENGGAEMEMDLAHRVLLRVAPGIVTDILMRRLERDFKRLCAEGCVPVLTDSDRLTEAERDAGLDKAFANAYAPMQEAISYIAEQVVKN